MKKNTVPSKLISAKEPTSTEIAWARSLSQPELERLSSFFSLLIQIDQRASMHKKGALHEAQSPTQK